MDHFLLIFGLLICPLSNYAQNVDANTSVTATTWFWPLLSICLALLISVPCTLITIVIFCYNKKNVDDSDQSNIDSHTSSSSSSFAPVPHQSTHHHHHHHPPRSHYAGAFRSPPPPYTTGDRPEYAFVTASLPPPYEHHTIETNSRPTILNHRTTVINVEPAESSIDQSTTNPRVETTFDVSSTITNPSIQTFQV